MKRIIFAVFTVFLLSMIPVSAQDTTSIDAQPTQVKELTEAQKDSVLFEKLSPDQLLELKKMEAELEKQRIEARSKNEMPFDTIGLIIIVLSPFLFVIAIVLISSRSKQAEAKRRYDIYLKSNEMGQPVPPHFFDEPKAGKASNLKRGIISLMVGLAFGIYAIISGNDSLPFLLAALIPGFVGIGYLLVHRLEKPKNEIAASDDEQN